MRAPDGSHPQKVALGYSPTVSPDGRWIAYLHKGQQTTGRATTSLQSLWLVSSKGGQRRQIGQSSQWFEVLQWSPDSRRFLVVSAPGLVIVDRSRGTIRLLSPTRRRIGIGTASFSPDGRSVVYDRSDRRGIDIYAVSVDSGPSRRLTDDHQSSAPPDGGSPPITAQGTPLDSFPDERVASGVGRARRG